MQGARRDGLEIAGVRKELEQFRQRALEPLLPLQHMGLGHSPALGSLRRSSSVGPIGTGGQNIVLHLVPPPRADVVSGRDTRNRTIGRPTRARALRH